MVASMRSAMLNSRRSPACSDKRRATFLITSLRGIGDRIDRVTESDDDLAVRDSLANVRLGFVGRRVAVLDFEGDLVGATMFRSAQGADARP